MLIQDVERYLKIRRTFGYKLEATEHLLRSFACFAQGTGDTYVVSRTVIQWAEQSTTQRQRDKRIRIVSRFARFLYAENVLNEIPPDGIYQKKQRRPVPYIFTEEEILLLLAAAGRLGPAGSLRPHTYQTLLGLLAVTGLRISEALSIRMSDIGSDGLLIRESKFRKTRLVPLHQTSSSALVRYIERRKLIAGNDDHLFVSLHRKKLSYRIVSRTFRELCITAGLPKQASFANLRLHDLRHTFAVRALERCPHDRDAVSAHMLALSTYMGHASIKSTYWYLDSTPQLMQDIAMAAESLIYGGTA